MWKLVFILLIIPKTIPSFRVQCGFSSFRHRLYSQLPDPERKIIICSDSSGSTAQRTLNCAFSQFDCTVDARTSGCDVNVAVFAHCANEETASGIVKQAKNSNSLLLYTLSDPDLRAKTQRMCVLSNVNYVDLMGDLLDKLTDFFGEAPLGTPGKERVEKGLNNVVLSDNYYKRIEAVEFTLKADDGANSYLLKDADLILLGVSRTGKTPLSVVIAQQMGLKVANIPLVLEVAPPKELFEACIDTNKVFCLTINPVELKRIRLNRLERNGAAGLERSMGGGEGTQYADRNYLIRDLKSARDLAKRLNCTEIDVTGRAVEETASLISSLLLAKRKIEK